MYSHDRYRAFELLRHFGDTILPITMKTMDKRTNIATETPFNQSGPLTIIVTLNTTSNTLHIYLSNFAPDDNGKAHFLHMRRTTDGKTSMVQDDPCWVMKSNNCQKESCYLRNTDFPGNDLLPERLHFRTPNASSCCTACLTYKPDKFCEAWVWEELSGHDPGRCYLKRSALAANKKAHLGFIAGFPAGIPPPKSGKSWYKANQKVRLQIDSARTKSTNAVIRTINSTCANPKAMLYRIPTHQLPIGWKITLLANTLVARCYTHLPLLIRS